MNKTLSKICAVLIFSISLPTLYAQQRVDIPSSIRDGTSQRSTGSTLPIKDSNNMKNQDTISTPQSSTTSTDCINSSSQGLMCGASATNWCKTNANTTECMNFNKNSNPSSAAGTMP